MSGPNLSEYFRNDAPSMFDEIIPNTIATASSTTATTTAAALATGRWFR